MTLFGRVAAKARNLTERADARLFGVEFAKFDRLLKRELIGHGETLLDVGCGSGSPLYMVKDAMRRSVGVDIHLPSILDARSRRLHDAYICADVLRLETTIAPRSFDCVASIDVIEHLTVEQGERFLRVLEGLARKRVVIFTPNGFLPQPAAPDNSHQLHISGWSAATMQKLGYQTYGVNGWRPLRGMYAKPRRPRWLTHRLALLTEGWFESRPAGAFQLLCVKDVA